MKDSPLNENPGNILLVDDHPENLRLLGGILEKEGYLVRAVTSGKLALMSIESKPPDLVLMDVIMPEMDGYETCRKIGENPETCHIPVIFISALNEPTDQVKGFEVGGVDFITKPFEGKIVLSRINTHLELAQIRKLLNQERDLLEAKVVELNIAREQAESANRAKSDFLSCMSHELRTPLNAILGFTQIMQRRNLGTNTDQSEGLAIIQQSGDHLLTLINDILDLAKVEAGKLELHATELHFPEFLDGLAGIILSQVEAKELVFRLVKKATLPVGIQADEVRLRQVLLNLLTNAIKFTRSGEVILRVSPVGDENSGNQVIRFEVVDTGIGIPENELDKIFQPFEQTGDHKDRIKGMGLGLSISRQLVGSMGGNLEIESRVGQGSTFSFEVSFPIIEVEPRGRSGKQTVLGYEGKRQKIMIVDDNWDNRLMLLNMLEPLGFETVVAENGREAVDNTRETEPDLILMDLVMPLIDGYEATRLIHRDEKLKNIPIIAVSASILETDMNRDQNAEYDAFLSKPIWEEKLFALLQKHLGLVWIYGKQQNSDMPENAAAGPLIPPPKEELAVLHDLARIGNMHDIEIRADHVADLGQQYVPFAAKLKQLATDFKEKAILKLVEDHLVRGEEYKISSSTS